jgi:hypothetical protein
MPVAHAILEAKVSNLLVATDFSPGFFMPRQPLAATIPNFL